MLGKGGWLCLLSTKLVKQPIRNGRKSEMNQLLDNNSKFCKLLTFTRLLYVKCRCLEKRIFMWRGQSYINYGVCIGYDETAQRHPKETLVFPRFCRLWVIYDGHPCILAKHLPAGAKIMCTPMPYRYRWQWPKIHRFSNFANLCCI